MAEEYGPEAGPDADPIGVQTQDGVQIGNNFYNFRKIIYILFNNIFIIKKTIYCLLLKFQG